MNELRTEGRAAEAVRPPASRWHVAHGRDPGTGWYRTQCDCRLQRPHPVGARGMLAPVIPLKPEATRPDRDPGE